MGPADSDRIPRVPPYSGGRLDSCLLRVRASHPVPGAFPGASACGTRHVVRLLQPRNCRNSPGLGSFPFARHYSGNRSFFLFLQVLRCFSSLGSRLAADELHSSGFPHSDTCGSTPVGGSPHIFAAYCVLPRRRKPRHPPFALVTSLDMISYLFKTVVP